MLGATVRGASMLADTNNSGACGRVWMECAASTRTIGEAVGGEFLTLLSDKVEAWLASVLEPTRATLGTDSSLGALTTTAGAGVERLVPFMPRSTPMGDQTPPDCDSCVGIEFGRWISGARRLFVTGFKCGAGTARVGAVACVAGVTVAGAEDWSIRIVPPLDEISFLTVEGAAFTGGLTLAV